MSATDQIVTAFDRAGYFRTDARLTMAELVAARTGHFTAADLVDEIRSRRLGIGRATVFRTLEAMETLGVIERIDLPSGGHAYLRCDPAHHHHVVCSQCGRAAEILDNGVAAIVTAVARQTGYRVDEHRLELFGLCPVCLAKQPGRPTSSH